MPIGQASTDVHANLLGLVLKDSREDGVYTRVGYFELVWSYGEKHWHLEVQRVRWRNGRVARDDTARGFRKFPNTDSNAEVGAIVATQPLNSITHKR
jgi:hypothetical protein